MTPPVADHVNGQDHDGGDYQKANKAREVRHIEQAHSILRADTKDGCRQLNLSRYQQRMARSLRTGCANKPEKSLLRDGNGRKA